MDSVPILDLHQPHEEIVAQLDAALKQFGFFYVTNHGIPQELIDEQFKISKQLFDLPEDVKQSMPFDGTLDIGYLGSGGQALEKTLIENGGKEEKESELPEDKSSVTNQIDTKEQFMMTNNKLVTTSSEEEDALRVDPDNVFGGSQNYNLLPHIPDHPRVTSSYMSAAYKLNWKLNSCLFDALNLDKSTRDALGNHPFLVLKQMKYAGPPSDPSRGQYGAGPHTDWGSFTILATDMQPGLQILWDNKWLDVPPIENALIINSGDQIGCLTNHHYKSALHRVVTTSRRMRYSTAVFTYFGMTAKFGPLPQFCDDGKAVEDLSLGRTTREYFHYKLHQSVYGSQEEKKE
jgi:isopenicillin N synthase-like dioxygenase